MTRTCNRCGQAKAANAFKTQWVERDQKTRVSGSCRKCINAAQQERYSANPGRYRSEKRADAAKHADRRNAERRGKGRTPEQKERDKARAFEWRYGITLEQRDEMLAAQGGVCKICQTPDPGGRGEWCTDHDHACCPQKSRSCGSCIRGILCFGCNVMLGCAKDSPSTLQSAIEYLGVLHGKA